MGMVDEPGPRQGSEAVASGGQFGSLQGEQKV